MTDDSDVEMLSTSNSTPITRPDLYHAAKYLRMELKGVKNRMSDPPSAEKLTLDEAQVPMAVYNFLVRVMSSKEVYDDEVTVDLKLRKTDFH